MLLPKHRALRSKTLRDSAKGEDCTLQVAGVCQNDTATVVLAHLDTEGKGMAYKSPDYAGAFACSACHAAIDQHLIPEEDRQFYMLRGMLRTWARWIDMGLISIKGAA